MATNGLLMDEKSYAIILDFNMRNISILNIGGRNTSYFNGYNNHEIFP